MIPRLLVPLDGSANAEAALPFAALIPSERITLLQTENPAAGIGMPGPGDIQAWRAERQREMDAYLSAKADELRARGRTVDTVAAWADPAAEIIGQARPDDLIVMTTRGQGGAVRALFGSVADRVARHGNANTLLIRVADGQRPDPMVARLVVPVDGSDLADEAIPVAVALGQDLGVCIHLVRVVPDDAVRDAVRGGPFVSTDTIESWRRQAASDAERDLEETARAIRNQDCDATLEVRFGDPREQLVAALKPGDLLVMSSHGRGGLGRWMLGSVADHLVHHAPAPVLLVRARGAGS